MRGTTILLGIVIAVAAVRDTRADCRRTCQAGESRDGRGCCVAAKGKQSKAPVKPKKPKKPTGGTSAKGTTGTGSTATTGTTGGDTAVADPPPPRDPPRDPPAAKSQKNRSTQELVDGCREKDAAACRELMRRDDSGIDAGDYAEAMTAGCDLDVWTACTELGAKTEKGAGVKQDFTRARSLYKKACDHKDLGGCHRLGQVYFLALGVVKDIEQARTLFGTACRGGMVGACSDLGYLEESEGDYQAAFKDYVSACAQGSGVACGNAAILAEKVGDYDNASTYYKKACDLGRSEMCGR